MSVSHPKSWHKTRNNSGTEQSSIARYNGNIIPRKSTWEKEEELRKVYLELFRYTTPQLRDDVFFKGEGCNILGFRTIMRLF
jgi:hypothetical protein